MKRGPKPKTFSGLVRNDDATPELIRIAGDRIKPHLDYLRMADYDLRVLLTNVWLQGCRDMSEAMTNKQLSAEL